jgi:hypothetical protein
MAKTRATKVPGAPAGGPQTPDQQPEATSATDDTSGGSRTPDRTPVGLNEHPLRDDAEIPFRLIFPYTQWSPVVETIPG